MSKSSKIKTTENKQMNSVTVKKFVGTTPEALGTLAAYIESELNAGATIRQVAFSYNNPSGEVKNVILVTSIRRS